MYSRSFRAIIGKDMITRLWGRELGVPLEATEKHINFFIAQLENSGPRAKRTSPHCATKVAGSGV